MAERKTKLHELLAVSTSVRTQAEKVRTDLIETFRKKQHLFTEQIKTFQPLDENSAAVTEEVSDLQTTVEKEMRWIAAHLTKAIDVQHKIALANTVARADVVLESGATILRDMPATSLLELEKSLADVQSLLAAIPTLDPAKGFMQDPNRGVGISVARDIIKDRTRKETKVLIKYEATKEHPAQTELITQDVVIGKIRQSEWSGMVTPAAKAEILGRVEGLLRSVKQARSRANEVEVTVGEEGLGKALLGYLLEPLTK